MKPGELAWMMVLRMSPVAVYRVVSGVMSRVGLTAKALAREAGCSYSHLREALRFGYVMPRLGRKVLEFLIENWPYEVYEAMVEVRRGPDEAAFSRLKEEFKQYLKRRIEAAGSEEEG